MGRLTTLKPRLQAVSASRVQVLAGRPDTVPRLRGSAGVRDREAIKRRDCGICQECKRKGRVTIGRVVDHIKPLWDGGSDDESNKELLCDPCHDAKTAREAGIRAAGGSTDL